MKKRICRICGISCIALLLTLCVFVFPAMGATPEIESDTTGSQNRAFDTNKDYELSISDVTVLLSYLSTSPGECPVDPDENGEVTIADVTAMLSRLACVSDSRVYSSCLEYTYYSGGYYAVSGIGNCTDTQLIIPETYKGIPVTTVSSNAFVNCATLTEVTVPESVTSLGSYSFQGCVNLKSVDFGGKSSLTSIGSGAFSGCEKLERFYSEKAGELVVPVGVTSIGDYAFALNNNSAITTITVPDSVTKIESGAFKGCNGLEEMTLPFVGGSVTSGSCFGYIFGSNNVSGDGHLTSAGQGYTSQDYYNGYGYYIEYYIPASLRKVTITLDTTIPRYAFRNCDLIEIISLPNNVTSIGNYAFENCTGLTNLYFGGTASDWKGISFGSYWNRNANSYYLHCNASEYGIYLPTGAVRLPIAGTQFMLFPTKESADIQVFDIKTGKLLALDQTDIIVDVLYTNGQLSLNGDRLTSKKGGVSTITAYYYNDDGEKVILEEKMPVFVVDHSEYSADPLKFSLSEREYIGLCLDMFYSMYQIDDPQSIVDTDLNVIEELLFGISNLGDTVAGFFKGDLADTTLYKGALSKFISEYVDNNYAHYRAVEDTESVLAGMKAVNEAYKKNEKWLDLLPHEILKMIREVSDYYVIMEAEGVVADQLTDLTAKLYVISQNTTVANHLVTTDAWLDFIKHTNSSYEHYLDAANRIHLYTQKSENSMFFQKLTKDKTIKAFKDGVPGVLDTAFIGLDAVIYGVCDYSRNIEVLGEIRDGLYQNGYTDDDIEVHVINELIEEYQNKELEAVETFIANFAAETIVNIATKHPVLTIVKVASEISMEFTAIDEKVELIALGCYRSALRQCIYPVDDLYFNGKVSSDTEEVKQFVSLYLSILMKSNNLAVKIAMYEDSDEDFTEDIYQLNYNTSIIQGILDTYF